MIAPINPINTKPFLSITFEGKNKRNIKYMEGDTHNPDLKQLFIDNGWTYITCICTIIFTLFHFPCATTLIAIKKETNSKWMIISILLPLIIGLLLCFIVNTIAYLW